MRKTSEVLKQVPLLGGLLVKIKKVFRPTRDQIQFVDSPNYWEDRYVAGGNSGSGSYGRLATFKADVLNQFVLENNINSILEFGCGDGNQLSLAKYPNYIGFDVSPTIIRQCSQRFAADQSKSFFLYNSLAFTDNHRLFSVDLTMSLDVIYHLVEDHIFESYMRHLFAASKKFVIVYASNFDLPQSRHERDRMFTKWIEANIIGWELLKKIDNKYPYRNVADEDETSKADFFIYKKID